jgi:hypothetical protein
MPQLCNTSVAMLRLNPPLRCLQRLHPPQTIDLHLHRSRLPLPALNQRSTLQHFRYAVTTWPPFITPLALNALGYFFSVSCVTPLCLCPCSYCPASRPSLRSALWSRAKRFRRGSWSRCAALHVYAFQFDFACAPWGAPRLVTTVFQNRELVEIVRALQGEREGLLGELSDALQVILPATAALPRVLTSRARCSACR